ncbi:MAG: hypothetical protein HWN79_17615 [Candidatus Lokiarchaeota archaeon]|nr:hypothetical protein [Candidatus Lokiarchaeota archaeon]
MSPYFFGTPHQIFLVVLTLTPLFKASSVQLHATDVRAASDCPYVSATNP